MKVEYKLPPATAQFAQTTQQQLNELRREYLVALGLAKESEMRADMLRQALSQQLAIVQQAEGLPQPLAPYQLSADGAALTGDIADSSPVVSVNNGHER